MIHAFYMNSPIATPELMMNIFRLRHQVFVENLNWEDLRRSDNLERDEFDHDGAIHVALVDDAKVSAYSRLLPTIRPHLLSEIYPEIMQGRIPPRGPHVWEWTRLCCSPESETKKSISIRLMMVAVAELALALRAHKIIAQSDPIWIARLNRLGWNAKPLAIPIAYGGSSIVPLEARVTPLTVETSRKRLGISGDIVDWSEFDNGVIERGCRKNLG